MKIIDLPIDELIPYENNPRNNAPAVKAVAESIKQFGFKVPIVIDKDNVIVAGHTRHQAALLLGLDSVPVIKADDLNDEQVRAFRLADNKTAELADWETDKLQKELSEINEIDMLNFGFEPPATETDNDEPAETTTSNFEYKPQFGVIVTCQDKMEQGDVYEALIAEGYDCKKIDT